jgi:mannitol-specific phosphotransferase system IIBC component
MPSLTTVAAGAIVALTVSNLLFIHLWKESVNEYAEYRAEVTATNAKLAEENRAKIEQAKQDTSEVAANYVRSVDGLERTYASRLAGLRKQASNCATVSLVAESASLHDGTAADDGSRPGSFEAACERLERDCARTTLTHIYLQDWVRRVCK